jgi:hypothetical protein
MGRVTPVLADARADQRIRQRLVMDEERPRDRREGPAGTAAPLPPRGTESPRHRFRQFLADRMGGVSEAAWYLDQVMPKYADDPEARLAAEELLDHVGRLLQFGVARNDDADVSIWTTRRGTRMAVALVDAFEAVAGIGRAARSVEELRTAAAHEGHEPCGLLCVLAGEIQRRPIEQLLDVRRLSQAVRVIGLPSIVALARAVESGALTPEAVAALLEPGVFADAIVAHLTGERGPTRPINAW